MDAPDKRFSDLVDVVKSWIPRRTVSETVSRDFWMPDQSCRVCYECDSQFTIFNRRHHCRLCGRVFCAKCTANSIPAPSDEPKTIQEEWERIRVCNYCFKHWERRIATIDNENRVFSSGLSPSPSSTSLASTKSSATRNSNDSTIYSIPNSTGPYQHLSCGSSPSPLQSKQTESGKDKQDVVASVTARNVDIVIGAGDPSPDQFGSFKNRSDDDDDEYGMYQSDSEARNLFHANDYYGAFDFDDMDNAYGSPKFQPDEQNIVTRGLSSSPLCKSLNSRDLEGIKKLVEESDGNDTDLFEPSSTLYEVEGSDAEPVDFENNRLLWLPPEPEDFIFDDDDDNDQGDTGEWGHLRSSSSLGSGDYCNRDRSCEDHNKAMKNVVDGHFRALVAQLLQVENLPVGEEDEKEGWLEIVTSLSWEAASLLKPDTSKSGGMDPGGYVKVKCLACGRRSESMVVKGIVFKKNVAHRRMTSKIAKPQLLILGGALEYQRVSNLLSSFDTLLQQEMDHLKMAVAKIDAQHPNVLLVEKSVSRFAQEYLLAKDISLVLNIKRPLLERIARSTGAHIVPSIDNLSSQKLGHCDLFHVEKFFEEHGTAGQFGKKSMKTLMFFDGCPKPLGFTILLKGANGDELKKLKHVVQYGVFAAYHLALETSFLADEGASLPEIPLKSPITVTLPDKLASIDRSISIIPGFTVPDTGKPQQPQTNRTPRGSNTCRISDRTKLVSNSSSSKIDMALSPCLFNGPGPQFTVYTSFASFSTLSSSSQSAWGPCDSKLFPHNASEEKTEVDFKELKSKASDAYNDQTVMADNLVANSFGPSEALGKGVLVNTAHADLNPMVANHLGTSEFVPMQDSRKYHEELESTKEEFPPSPSDHQSILFSSSTRCVWKGTVCERAHLFRIKYYGTFDKPLGRFLRDHLFDQSYRCNSCEMPSEAHVHCYIHRQGSLTISVTKLPEFLLAGEREGKIWMWHRCLRCPRTNGFPPATRRVLMSDAAWGLSFGKFLELSFSNHAAASRVATCGHSLHRDCLRFYGFGRMIACFRYASIDVHSVYLPPPKLDFSYEIPECVQKEMNEVVHRAKVLFTEVLNALHKISEKRSGNGSLNSRMKELESKFFVAKLEGVLQNEKLEFEESLQKALTRELKKGQPTVDVLEINRLQRQLLFQSYMWDQCLIYAADSGNNTRQEGLNRCIPKVKEKPLSSMEKIVETDVNSKPGRGFSSCDSVLVDAKQDESINQQVYSSDLHGLILKEQDTDEDLTCGKERQDYLSSGKNLGDHVNHQESEVIRRALCDGQFPIIANLSDTLDAAWTGENHPGSITPKENGLASPASALSGSSTMVGTVQVRSHLEDNVDELSVAGIAQSLAHVFPTKKPAIIEDSVSWGGMPLLNLYHSLNKNSSGSVEKLDFPGEYSPVYVLSLRDLERQSGARLRLPVGFDKTVVLVYDDEPTSIISYALVSPDYHVQISEERDKPKYGGESSASLQLSDSMNLQSVHSFDETASESVKSLGSTDENILSISGSQSSLVLDPLLYTKALHVRVSFADDGPLGKVKYSVTCYYAKRFEALRKICCPSELDFIRSLCRCKKWGAQGGKSNVFFAKTLDDRFIVKQVTKTELEAFIKFAPAYFKYLSESIGTGSPTCLAKILGIYQVTSKHLKGGKESKMDVLVMENLLFRRNVTRLYDLKGSSRSRYNPDSSGNNKVLLDQNLIEAMPTSPIFVGNKAKRLLERAVWNDTSFLASIDVMDYSLLVGVDEEKHELVLGIIDFMRQYTWDKHLETWVKASGILGGPKNSSPTVISPKQYKKRFRKAMSTYFLMVPDQWFHPNIIPSGTQSDLCEENPQGGASLE